jgi:hypothetical protein
MAISGANLPFYAGVETLTLTEPDKPMVHRLKRRLGEYRPGSLLRSRRPLSQATERED